MARLAVPPAAVYSRRVMKARRTGPVDCGHVVLTGQRIVRIDGSGWLCVPCVLAQIRHAADLAHPA
jgi:hypothetical protein